MNDEHKDRVFRFLFGNPENREWTLNLYKTIEDAVYLGMKNDTSFFIVIVDELNLCERQRTS